MAYDLTPFKVPRLTGGSLRLLAAVADAPVAGALMAQKMLSDVGVPTFRDQVVADPPVVAPPGIQSFAAEAATADPLERSAGTDPCAALDSPQFLSASWLTARYRSGELSPLSVAERLLRWVQRNQSGADGLSLFISQNNQDVLTQARASEERYRRGAALGPLDGVPVAVKDDLDQAGYPTTAGTRTRGKVPALVDGAAVARLRACGAVLIGKTNLHELGLGVTGNNPHYGATRNPYDRTRISGGSSSGSSAAVAAGVCPLAVGADGGGSIRIPASLCGVVGLKPTFGRVSVRGAAEICWSVAHVGPIGATVHDVAIGLAAMSGREPGEPATELQPPLQLAGWSAEGVSGLRLGVYPEWFDDCEPGVLSATRRALAGLVEAGATVVEITVEDLRLARTAHMVTIVAEMVEGHLASGESADELAGDSRLNLALGKRLTAADYVHAQRARTKLARQLCAIFNQVDLIVTPTTACVATELGKDALASGESNLAVTESLTRFTTLANLVGLPALTVPCGYDADGLPVGLQALAPQWQERLLLRFALEVERISERRRPSIWCDLRRD